MESSTISSAASEIDALAELRERIAQGHVFVLTGAGVSTDSGIPAYRDERGAWKGREPMQYREFVGSLAARRRYWARSMIGFSFMANAKPNAAHHALSELERRGALSLLVTQNVDGLHRRAGSENLVDLHGRIDQVKCLGCGAITSRARLQSELVALNSAFAPEHAVIKPDGDAELDAASYDRFRIVDCAHCGGMLKPDLVFFGENVPAERVKQAMAALERARLLLVVGSSLMVFSGFRFARAAARLGVPIALLNRGTTRADEFAALKISSGIAETLSELAA
ncbi:MAG TPA: NAD-dependent protein deacetylase [Polyangiaceae bacterium]